MVLNKSGFLLCLTVLGLFINGVGLTAARTTAVKADLAEWKADGLVANLEYQKYQKLDLLEVYSRIDGGYVMLAIQAPTTGYLALGINPKLVMNKADMLLMCVKSDKVEAEDMYFSGFKHPADTSLGGTNDLELLGGTEKNGVTTVEFRRKLNTGDKFDRPLVAGKNKVIWAISDSDAFTQKHKQRGAGILEL